MRYARIILSTIAAALLTIGCSEKEEPEEQIELPIPDGPVIQSEKQKFVVDTLTDILKNPWGIAFLPDGRVLVTEREGTIRIFKDDVLLNETIEGMPEISAAGQGGLHDIQLHPNYAANGFIYLAYAKPGGDGWGTTLARAKLEGNKLVNLEELFIAQPYSGLAAHFGGRIAFDGKGHVFMTSGERGEMHNAQDLSNHLGKIIRVNDDGTVPADNPFVNQQGAKPEIWSYGHRNPQGLIYDMETGILWSHEHGPMGGDELNKIERGKNYGWPAVTYGNNYDGQPISDKTEMDGMEPPVTYWVPSIAPCGMTKVSGNRFANWKGNLLIGALAHQHVARVELDGDAYVRQEKLLDKIARVRAVAESPDGYIYIATESPGMLIKLYAVK